MINQYWAHKSSGEVFAVQIDKTAAREVISACGPLYYKEVTAANLDSWIFHSDPEDVQWLNEKQDDFGLLEAPYKGDEV